MEDFHSLGLPEALLQSLKIMEFHKPTPIQAQTIPVALQGQDVLGSSQTGTGKTAAYGIPLVSYLLKNPTHTALILTPTRELALQVLGTLHQLVGRKSGIYTALLIGGDSMVRQLRQLRSGARLIVGTPGRVFDHLDRGSLKLDKAHFLVLDEMDRMLDMGFSIQLEKIAQFLPEKRQTLMFSATMSPTVIKTAKNYLGEDAVRVSVGSTTAPIEKIKQETIHTTEPEKYDALVNQLNQSNGAFIVFVKTKWGTEKLADKLRDEGYEADAIHGDLRQRNRERVIKSFRNGVSRILVATDVAARGLDIPSIECVVNFDLPQCPEDYIHRIGRTGRAGAEGRAVNLITAQDRMKWKLICRLINNGESVEEEGRSGRSSGGRRGGSNDSRRRSSGGRRFGGSGNGGFSRGGGRGGRSNSRGDRGDRSSEFGDGTFSREKRRNHEDGGSSFPREKRHSSYDHAEASHGGFFKERKPRGNGEGRGEGREEFHRGPKRTPFHKNKRNNSERRGDRFHKSNNNRSSESNWF